MPWRGSSARKAQVSQTNSYVTTIRTDLASVKNAMGTTAYSGLRGQVNGLERQIGTGTSSVQNHLGAICDAVQSFSSWCS